MPLRKVFFWIHLMVGLTAGLVILMMCVTGVILTYERQMVEWSDRQFWGPPERPGERATTSLLLATAAAATDEADPSRITWYSGTDGPVAVSIGGGRTAYLDPSTGALRGLNTTGMRAFMGQIRGWHRWFNVARENRSTARLVTGWSNLVFLFLLLSGLYLWIPRKWTWRHFKTVLVFRPRAQGKARDFNWHNTMGFWAAIPMLLIVVSAAVISFPWARDAMLWVVGAPEASSAPTVSPPAQEAESEPQPFDVSMLDAVVPAALARIPDWRSVSLSIPEEAGQNATFQLYLSWTGDYSKRTTLVMDPRTGDEVSSTGWDDLTPARRARIYMRFVHTGEFYGLWGQTIAGLVSLIGVILVWTGTALAWRRLIRPRLRRGRTRRARGSRAARPPRTHSSTTVAPVDRDRAPGRSDRA